MKYLFLTAAILLLPIATIAESPIPSVTAPVVAESVGVSVTSRIGNDVGSNVNGVIR